MKTLRRSLAIAGLMLAALVVLAPPGGAHTGFESSNPADGSSVDVPVDEITLTFSGPAEPAGEGFQALDASGEVRTPTEATTADGAVWKLTFDPPLGGGEIGVRWSVKAPDAHPIDGGFSFRAPAPAPAPTTTAPTTSAAQPDTETATPPADEADGQPTDGAAPIEESPIAESAPASQDLDEFLSSESRSTTAAQRLADVGRIAGVLGVLAGLGALAFAAWVLRGEREDIALVLGWARRSGVAIIAGGLIELVAQTNLEAVGDWGATFSGSNARAALASSFGIAVALRIVGGVLLLTGTRMTTRPVVAPAAADLAVPQAALIGVGGAQPSAADRPPPPAPGGDRAWQPSPASSMALVGVGLILASHIFGGHTVTEGYRPLTAILDMIHVAAAAIWAGGLVMIIAVSWKRFVEDRSLRTGELAVRFSVVAAAALAAVTVAGLGLSIIILDAPAELWTTPWGRLLVAKVAFAGVAIAAGAYNHRVLVPALHADPDDESVVTRFRTAVAAEVALLLVVGVLTAFLVGASSV